MYEKPRIKVDFHCRVIFTCVRRLIPSTSGVTLQLRDANATDLTAMATRTAKIGLDYSAFRSLASQTLDKEGRTDCPVEWSLLVLPPALVELEGVSLLVELEDRSALALLKDGSFVQTICAIRSIS